MEPAGQVQRPRRARSVAVGLLLPLGAAAVLNVLFLRLGEPSWLRALTGLAISAAIPLTPIAIFRGLGIFEEQDGVDFPLLGRLLATAILSFFWYFLALTIFVNVHLWSGGSL
jgi:hypothetical protein